MLQVCRLIPGNLIDAVIGAAFDRGSSQMSGGRSSMLIWTQYQVDEQGGVRDFRVDNLTPASQRTLQYYERRAKQQKFLPGYYEGRPAAKLYVEPIFSTD